jgi:glycosyltransferase involved in cell wall biosynthesis
MRILQATDCYPPPLIGGRDLQVRMLSKELADRGHEVHAITLAGASGARTERDGNVTVHRVAGWSRALNRVYVDPDRPWHPTVPDPGMVRAVAGIIREVRPDVVHSHSWIIHSLLPLLPKGDIALVATMHDYGLVCAKNTFLHRGTTCTGPRYTKCVACSREQYGVLKGAALTTGLAVTLPLRQRVDQYIAVSSPVAQACRSLVSPGGRPIEVIPPLLLDQALDGGTGRPDFVPQSGDYIMFAGALSVHKGVHTLLDAFSGLDRDVDLVIVGIRNNDTQFELPDRATVVEDVPHSDVLRAWENCAFAVVPSQWPDPSPLVAMEAMAAGRPVIASAVGGLPDLVVDGTTGVLVPPGDATELRTAMAALLDDPARRAEMGAAAEKRAVRYSASVVVPRIEKVYREVVDARRSSR